MHAAELRVINRAQKKASETLSLLVTRLRLSVQYISSSSAMPLPMEEFWGLVSAAKGTTGIVDQCIALFAFAGALSTAGFVLRYTQFLWRQFLRPAKSLKKYGKWAIVTGATDGIGREYCNFLAKQGARDRPPRHLSALRSARVSGQPMILDSTACGDIPALQFIRVAEPVSDDSEGSLSFSPLQFRRCGSTQQGHRL